MPIVNITTWKTSPDVKQSVMEKITKLLHEETGAPLDKITVYFLEIEKNDWAEAGILGSNPYFREKSRRQTYENV